MPVEIQEPCREPVTLTGTTARHVEHDWKKDRYSLLDCKRKHEMLVAWNVGKDRALTK